LSVKGFLIWHGFPGLSFFRVCQFGVSIPPCNYAEMTDLATLPTGVYLRPGSSVFHLRIGVPKDLQQHFRNPKTGTPKTDAFRGKPQGQAIELRPARGRTRSLLIGSGGLRLSGPRTSPPHS